MSDPLPIPLTVIFLAFLGIFILWRAVHRWRSYVDIVQMAVALAALGAILASSDGGLGETLGGAAVLAFIGTLIYWSDRRDPERAPNRPQIEPAKYGLRLARFGYAVTSIAVCLGVAYGVVVLLDRTDTALGTTLLVTFVLVAFAETVLVLLLWREIRRARREANGQPREPDPREA